MTGLKPNKRSQASKELTSHKRLFKAWANTARSQVKALLPGLNANAALPVLVYFYGGGFTAGDGSEFRYDGESLAKRGIVVVTMSYRLGIFGVFSHPELTAESPARASGNYALMDQTAALHWVRATIAVFMSIPRAEIPWVRNNSSSSPRPQPTSSTFELDEKSGR